MSTASTTTKTFVKYKDRIHGLVHVNADDYKTFKVALCESDQDSVFPYYRRAYTAYFAESDLTTAREPSTITCMMCAVRYGR